MVNIEWKIFETVNFNILLKFMLVKQNVFMIRAHARFSATVVESILWTAEPAHTFLPLVEGNVYKIRV